jgi:hypothetical protein
MSDKTDEHMIEELNETIQKKDPEDQSRKPHLLFVQKPVYRGRVVESTTSK